MTEYTPRRDRGYKITRACFNISFRRNIHDLGLSAVPKQILGVGGANYVYAKKMLIGGTQVQVTPLRSASGASVRFGAKPPS